MFDPNKVDRFDPQLGGCGDPECCGSYAEMNQDKDGEYVRYSDYCQLFALYIPLRLLAIMQKDKA